MEAESRAERRAGSDRRSGTDRRYLTLTVPLAVDERKLNDRRQVERRRAAWGGGPATSAAQRPLLTDQAGSTSLSRLLRVVDDVQDALKKLHDRE